MTNPLIGLSVRDGFHRWSSAMPSIREMINIAEGHTQPSKYLFFHVASEDFVGKIILSTILNEERKNVDLGQGREVFFHKAHVPGTQDHLHFCQRGAKLYALNRDGSAHDASHGAQMHQWAKDVIKSHYKGFSVPKDGLIEALVNAPVKELLLETENAILVPRSVQLIALASAQGS